MHISTRSSRSISTQQNAFSLVELVISVGILAILTTLIIGSIAAIRRSAQRSGCAANLHQLGIALQAYGDENQGELPALYGPTKRSGRPTAAFGVGIFQAGNDNGGMLLIVNAPLGWAQGGHLSGPKLFACPGDPMYLPPNDNVPIRSSYRYCYIPSGGGLFEPANVHPDTGDDNAAMKYQWTPGALAGLERHNVKQSGGVGTAVMIEGTVYNHVTPPTRIQFHGKGGNILYLDGHVNYCEIDLTPTQERDLKYLISSADHAGGA